MTLYTQKRVSCSFPGRIQKTQQLRRLFLHPFPLYIDYNAAGVRLQCCRGRKLNMAFRKKEGCGFIAEQRLKIKELERNH